MSFSLSSLLPWNWGGTASGTSGADQFTGYASAMSPGQSGIGGFVAPTADDPNTLVGQQTSGSSSGGMNWAGLSSGLSNLSKQLGGQQSSDSNKLSGSSQVSGTVSGGSLSPAGAGGGASALASADTARQQLAQYLILAAMQGKGRGKSGGGLLG